MCQVLYRETVFCVSRVCSRSRSYCERGEGGGDAPNRQASLLSATLQGAGVIYVTPAELSCAGGETEAQEGCASADSGGGRGGLRIQAPEQHPDSRWPGPGRFGRFRGVCACV